eukprot:4341417-Amphidinium_carterae.2
MLVALCVGTEQRFNSSRTRTHVYDRACAIDRPTRILEGLIKTLRGSSSAIRPRGNINDSSSSEFITSMLMSSSTSCVMRKAASVKAKKLPSSLACKST